MATDHLAGTVRALANTSERTLARTHKGFIKAIPILESYKHPDHSYDHVVQALVAAGVRGSRADIVKFLLQCERFEWVRRHKTQASPGQAVIQVTPLGFAAANEGQWLPALTKSLLLAEVDGVRPLLCVLDFLDVIRNSVAVEDDDQLPGLGFEHDLNEWVSAPDVLDHMRLGSDADPRQAARTYLRGRNTETGPEARMRQLGPAVDALRDDMRRDAAELIQQHSQTGCAGARGWFDRTKPTLILKARQSRRGTLIETLIALVEDASTADEIAEKALEDVLTTRWGSWIDFTKDDLKTLKFLGLVEDRNVEGEGRVWRITDCGVQMLAVAKSHIRRNRSRLSDWDCGPDTRRERLAAWVEKLGDRTEELAEDLFWGHHRGNKSGGGSYELAAVAAIVASVTPASDWEAGDGIRTNITTNGKVQALNAAPGGAGDAEIVLESGAIVMIEVTGVTGRAQVTRELEAISRHRDELWSANPDKVIYPVFVAPVVDPYMVKHVLADACPVGASPDVLVPVVCLNEIQLARITRDGIPLESVLEALSERLAQLAATPANELADVVALLIGEIDDIIDDASA